MQNTSFFMNSCSKYANLPELFTHGRLAPGSVPGSLRQAAPQASCCLAWLLPAAFPLCFVTNTDNSIRERQHYHHWTRCIPQGTEQDPLTNRRDAAAKVTVTSHVHLGSPQCLDHNTELMRTNWQQNTVHFHCKPNGDLREHTLMQ